MLKTEKQKKLLILHTGGTIGMGIFHSGNRDLDARGESRAEPLSPDHRFIRTLKKNVPELWRMARIHVLPLSNKDSSQLMPSDWKKIADAINAATDDYDAFIVTHGTDTMVYTGTALSYLLPYPCKPVVLTGSQRPLQEIRTDARRNLVNSVSIAASQRICEVSIFFDTALLRANRSKKVHIEEYHAFESPNFHRLAEERLRTSFHPAAREPMNRPTLEPRFETSIQVTKVFPGADVELAPGARAVVIEAFGCGNLPMAASSVHALLKKARAKKVPVILTSQVPAGSLSPDIYDMGRRALDLGAISSRDMTFEATLVKCMLLAGNDFPYEQWPAAIQANWSGEITPVTV